jgi:hypothetical protein
MRGRIGVVAKRYPLFRVYLWSCALLFWLLVWLSPRSARSWGVYEFYLLISLPALSYFVMLAIAQRGRYRLQTLLIVIALACLTLGLASWLADVVSVE